jgi:hypothetical protein
VSLIFSYAPKIKEWYYQKLDPQYRGLVMVGMSVVVALALFGLGCADVISGTTCDKQGALALVQAWIAFLVANQATYLLAPKSPAKIN